MGMGLLPGFLCIRMDVFMVVVVCCMLPVGWAVVEIPLGRTLRPPADGEPAVSWSSADTNFSLTFVRDPTRPSLYLAAVIYPGSTIPLWTPSANASVDSSGSLTLDAKSGDLRLLNGSASLVWHSSTSNVGVTAAVLDETGNLRLVTKSRSTVWQSFDHPTDTLLATQNFTSGQKLISGDYSLSFADPADLIITWNNSVEIYNNYFDPKSVEFRNKTITAPWTLYLDPLGAMRVAQPLLKVPYVVDYSSDYGVAEGMLRFLRLDSDGNLRTYSYKRGSSSPPAPQWAAFEDQCNVFAYCGNMGVCFYNGSVPSCRCPSPDFVQVDPSNARMGCKRRRALNTCEGNTTTVELKHTKFVEYPHQPGKIASKISDCADVCVANRSCLAVTVESVSSIACYWKTSSFLSGHQSASGPESSYVKVCYPPMSEQIPPPSLISEKPPSPSPSPSPLNPKRWSSTSFKARLIALVVVAAICVLVQLEFLVWWFFPLY